MTLPIWLNPNRRKLGLTGFLLDGFVNSTVGTHDCFCSTELTRMCNPARGLATRHARIFVLTYVMHYNVVPPLMFVLGAIAISIPKKANRTGVHLDVVSLMKVAAHCRVTAKFQVDNMSCMIHAM